MNKQQRHLLALFGALLLLFLCLSATCCTLATAAAAAADGATNTNTSSSSTNSNSTSSELKSGITQKALVTNETASTSTSQPTQASETQTTLIPTTTTSQPVTVREPTEQEINEARKIIQEVASSMKETNPHRLIMNKPAPSSLLHDYPADSAEARISEATSHFGLALMRTVSSLAAGGATSESDSSSKQDNTILSPISLQILMNLILLGTKDQSGAQLELARALGYESSASLALKKLSPGDNSSSLEDRARILRPHEAMHRVVDGIMKATHLSVEDRHLQRLLLNSNPAAEQPLLEAHLQTSLRDNDTPLSSQLNFTLANLMLTSSQLLPTSADYERELAQYYQTKVERFSRASGNASSSGAGAGAGAGAEKALHERVNEWVRNATQGQIGELVSKDMLDDPLLQLVLINAAHFKGQWQHTFNTRLTEERTFYNFGREPKETKFMRQHGQFAYVELRPNGAESSATLAASQKEVRRRRSPTEPASEPDDQETTVIEYTSERPNSQQQQQPKRPINSANISCNAISLPFSLNDGQEMSMVVLLPTRRDGLDELQRQLDVATLNEVYRALANSEPQSVQLELPKFMHEASHDVRPILEKLGVKEIFDERSAELEHMFGVPKPNAFVNKVIHKAKIAVDEKGAEAAAASLATVNMRSSILISVPTFTADRPFFYVIRHSRSNMPLFMGQVRRF